MKYSDKEFKYWVWYSRITNLSVVKKKRILEVYKSPEKIYQLDRKTLSENVESKLELSNDEIMEILNPEYRLNLNGYCSYMLRNKIIMITMFDNEFPKKLSGIYDSPVVLFARGNINLLKYKSVAIVGARDCSEYGKKVSRELAYDLSKQNICIISGLAKGIDKYAHIGALEACGKTIAVVGNGLDTIYPYENKNVYEEIIRNDGLIVSEYIIGTKPDKLNFPARNRIISALSEGIVVVEAKRKSGSLITADFGLEHGKEIFAVPGNINNVNSQGTNELIRQGANIVCKSSDITEILDF